MVVQEFYLYKKSQTQVVRIGEGGIANLNEALCGMSQKKQNKKRKNKVKIYHEKNIVLIGSIPAVGAYDGGEGTNLLRRV